MLGEPDQFTRQKLQRPTRSPCGWVGTGGGDQQGLLLAGELSFRPRPRLLAERRRQVAEHEAALCLGHGGPAHPDAPGNFLVAGAGIGCQQNLRALELACRMLAAAQKCGEFRALGLAEFDPIA